MSGSRGNSRKQDMNWLQIDAILWNMIKAWNGSESGRQDILKAVSKKFGWSESLSEKYCQMHFNMYMQQKVK